MRLQKLFITTLLSVSVIGTAIPANVSAASYATTKRTYTLKVAGKKQKKKADTIEFISTNVCFLFIFCNFFFCGVFVCAAAFCADSFCSR